MENKICGTEELEWSEGTKQHLRKICGWIKVFMISALCVFGICGCHLYKLYGLDAAVENLSFLALVTFLPATLGLLGCIRSNLEHCCQCDKNPQLEKDLMDK